MPKLIAFLCFLIALSCQVAQKRNIRKASGPRTLIDANVRGAAGGAVAPPVPGAPVPASPFRNPCYRIFNCQSGETARKVCPQQGDTLDVTEGDECEVSLSSFEVRGSEIRVPPNQQALLAQAEVGESLSFHTGQGEGFDIRVEKRNLPWEDTYSGRPSLEYVIAELRRGEDGRYVLEEPLAGGVAESKGETFCDASKSVSVDPSSDQILVYKDINVREFKFQDTSTLLTDGFLIIKIGPGSGNDKLMYHNLSGDWAEEKQYSNALNLFACLSLFLIEAEDLFTNNTKELFELIKVETFPDSLRNIPIGLSLDNDSKRKIFKDVKDWMNQFLQKPGNEIMLKVRREDSRRPIPYHSYNYLVDNIGFKMIDATGVEQIFWLDLTHNAAWFDKIYQKMRN